MYKLTPNRILRFPALTGTRERPIITWSRFSRLEPRVQFPLPQITTFLLLVHMAFGCCAHHAHTCEVNCCSEPAAVAEACACDTHLHDGPAEDSKSGDHGERHQCAGDHCTFVSSPSSPEQIDERATDLSPLEFVGTDVNVDLFRAYLDRSLDQRHSVAGISLRTHLALHVLLI
jgi:hypothetical protein